MDAWTIHRAAEEFGVPKSTLYNRVSGHVPFEARSGPPCYLNYQEEKQLVNFLIGYAKVGYAKSWKEVLGRQIDRWQKSISSKIDCLN